MIYQDFDCKKVYLDEYYVDGIQVVTAYSLYNKKTDAEYLLDSMTNNEYWAVEEIYRFYCLNDQIIKEKVFEIYYEPKKSHDDEFNIKTIKTFVKYMQLVKDHFDDTKTETIMKYCEHFRTDWYSPIDQKIVYRTIETGSEHNKGYKKFEWRDYNQKFMCGKDEYYGEMAEIDEVNEILKNIIKLNQTIEHKEKVLSLQPKMI